MNWGIIGTAIVTVLLIPTAYAGLIGAPWAPTRMAAVRKAFDAIRIGKRDVVIDLGAGDGSIIREAAKRGGFAIGYELSPIMWLVAFLRTVQYKKSRIVYGNFFKKALPKDTTRIFLFLMPKHMAHVRQYIASQGLDGRAAVLSYAFAFPDSAPEMVFREKGCAPLYLYTISELSRPFDNSGK